MCLLMHSFTYNLFSTCYGPATVGGSVDITRTGQAGPLPGFMAQSSRSNRQYRVISTSMVEPQAAWEPGGGTSPDQGTREGFKERVMLELMPGSRQRESLKVRRNSMFRDCPLVQQRGRREG